MVAVGVGYFVDSAIFLLLLLSSSAEAVTWWVTAVVLANLIPPIVLAGVLGWIVDRASGRLAWSSALLVSALCAAGIGLFESPIVMVVLAAVQSVCSVLVSAAVFKMLPMAPGLDERTASSFTVGIRSAAAIAAPPLAAIAATWNSMFAFLLCGGLLLAAVVIVAALGPRSARVDVESAAWHEVWLATRSLRKMAGLRVIFPAMLGVVLVTSVEGVAGVFYLQDVAGTSFGYALLLSAWAVGSVIGAGMTNSRRFALGSIPAVLVGGGFVAAAIFVEGLVPAFIVIAVVFVLGGAGNAVHNVGVRRLVYERVPSAQQGQVWSLVGASFSGAAAVGNFFGTPGLIASARDTIVIAGVAGIFIVGATLVWLMASRRQPFSNRCLL